jgi:hypothetical protein
MHGHTVRQGNGQSAVLSQQPKPRPSRPPCEPIEKVVNLSAQREAHLQLSVEDIGKLAQVQEHRLDPTIQ